MTLKIRRPRKSIRLADNEPVRLAYLNRRVRKPVVLAELKHYRATLPPARLKQLNIDETYQRIRIAYFVNDLIQTIKSGGSIPDPIALAERPDGTLWIVDGQQRFWAASECHIGLEATIYKVPDPITDNYATEKKLFYVLNRATSLNPITRMGSWAGLITDLLQRMNKSEAYAQQKIGFKSSNTSQYNPATLARGITALLGATPNGNLDSILRTSETLLANAENRQKAEAFLRLIPMVFHPSRSRSLSVAALGKVAAKRWTKRIIMPTKTSLYRLSSVDADKITLGSGALRFLPLLEDAYAKRWSADD